MSKGYGRIERAIMQTLADEFFLDTLQLTAAVFEREPNSEGVFFVTNAEIASVRRAANRLARNSAETDVYSAEMRGHRRVWQSSRFLMEKFPPPPPRWKPVIIQGGKGIV